MTIETYVSFFALSFIVCISPGPSMLFMVHQGLTKDMGNVLSGLFGLLFANIVWLSLCVMGVGVLLQRSHQMFGYLKIIGGMYLIYLGFKSLFDKNKKSSEVSQPNTFNSYLAVFIKGTLTSLSNPKALLFYIAFLPQFVNGNDMFYNDIAVLGGLNLLVISIVMLFYGTISNKIANIMNASKFQITMNKLIGISFIGFGLSLFRLKQS